MKIPSMLQAIDGMRHALEALFALLTKTFIDIFRFIFSVFLFANK